MTDKELDAWWDLVKHTPWHPDNDLMIYVGWMRTGMFNDWRNLR